MGMLNAPGPLMIDTLRRSGYQADTNVFLVGFLQEMAEALLWQSAQESSHSHSFSLLYEFSPSSLSLSLSLSLNLFL